MIRRGDRFRVTRSVESFRVNVIRGAPAHTGSCHGTLPVGTIIVAMDQQPGATGFKAYPQEYEQLETDLVPEETRNEAGYYAYSLSFKVGDVGDLLEPVSPLEPRPEDRLPRAPNGGR